MFSSPTDSWRFLWKETVRKIVKNYQKYMDVPEILEIVGQDKVKQAMAFKAANLDVMTNWVSTDHGLPRTMDERRQELMTLFDHGALDLKDVNVREKIFELFGETGMMTQFNADSTRARLENSQIKSGMFDRIRFMPQIEDLSVHFSVHSEQIKSLDFDTWPPAMQQALIEHATITKQAMEAAMAMQADSGLAAAARAGQPGPGGAGGKGGQRETGSHGGPTHPDTGPNKAAAERPPLPGKTQQGAAPTGTGSRGPQSSTPAAQYSTPLGGGKY